MAKAKKVSEPVAAVQVSPVKITNALVISDLKKRNHFIPRPKARKIVKSYQDWASTICAEGVPSMSISCNIDKGAISKLLRLPDCVGIRAYFALNESNALALVFVGIDSKNKNLLVDINVPDKKGKITKMPSTPMAADETQINPPYTGPSTV